MLQDDLRGEGAVSEIPEYEDCPRCDGKRAFEKGKGYTHCVWCEVIDLQKELEQVKIENEELKRALDEVGLYAKYAKLIVSPMQDERIRLECENYFKLKEGRGE